MEYHKVENFLGQVSVVIPAYNAEKYIVRLLDSLRIAQSNKLEVIVVDDGSTDNTANVVDGYSQVHQELNIKFISQSNQGVSSARNTGIGIAHGDYIWFVDADDEINPSCIDSLFQLFKYNYDIIWMETIHSNNGIDTSSSLIPKHLNGEISIDKFRKEFKGQGMLWQFIMKRQIITDNNIRFVEWAKWFEDVDFLYQYLCYVNKIFVFKDDWCYRYYVNPNGAMRNSNYSDRLLCSIKLSTNMLSRSFPDASSKNFCESQSAISIAWCIRSADKKLAQELFHIVHKYMPLRIAGTIKQRIQIALLNVSFPLYKKIFR